MGETKDAADVTDTPAGLDVAVTMPGTIVGSHDLQGTDGTVRTDRPGEILGTPVISESSQERRAASAQNEADRADYQTQEVDRANREELPLLGGTAPNEWELPEDAPAPRKDAQAYATGPRTAAPARGVTTADMAPARTTDSNIHVKSDIDRGKG